MILPLQITFRNMRPSPATRDHIRELFERLSKFHDRIVSCRVTVRAAHRSQRKGRLYQIGIDLKVPGTEIAVNRDPSEHHAHQDINVAVRDAFNAVSRRLRDVARQRRAEVKSHESEPHGRVTRLFARSKYGFIEGSDGTEVYFHANSVANDAFGRIKVGDLVRYSAEIGEKGLQATVVKLAGKRRMAV